MRTGSGGFTYVGLIVLVAIIGLVGAATLKVDALLRRAAAENELLETGAAFSAALRTYAEATPRGQPPQPPSLQDLLKDPRFPGVRRHLRKIFVDPMTGKAEWGIVWVNPGSRTGVLAVYSRSEAKPFKVANFDARFANFENRDHISEWKFAAGGQAIVAPSAPPAAVALAQPSLFPVAGSNVAPDAGRNMAQDAAAASAPITPPAPVPDKAPAPPALRRTAPEAAPPAAPPATPAPADRADDSGSAGTPDEPAAAGADGADERR